MGICCVYGCSNRTDKKKKSGVSFHKFPRNEEMKEKWVKALRRENWTLRPYSIICSDHFLEKFINRTSACGRIELRENAIPTVFPNYPSYLLTQDKSRKPPLPRGTISSPKSFCSKSEEPMDISEPFSKEVAVQKFTNRTSACSRIELKKNAISTVFPSYPSYLQTQDKYESKQLNEDDNTTDCDEDDNVEDEEYEEPNYETPNYSNINIKVEPGLMDEDSMGEYHALKEEVNDPLDISNMIDIDSTYSIKQEKDNNYESSLGGGIKIKEEPDSSDEDVNDVLSQNYSNDSSEGCSQSKEDSIDVQREIRKITYVKQQGINNAASLVKNSNEVKDDCQIFGDFVAEEMRNLKSNVSRNKLKSIIRKVLIEVSESES